MGIYGLTYSLYHPGGEQAFRILGMQIFMDGWMNGVLGHLYALSRLNWARYNLG